MVTISNAKARAISRLLESYHASLPSGTIKGRETKRKIEKAIKELNHELPGIQSKVQQSDRRRSREASR